MGKSCRKNGFFSFKTERKERRWNDVRKRQEKGCLFCKQSHVVIISSKAESERRRRNWLMNGEKEKNAHSFRLLKRCSREKKQINHTHLRPERREEEEPDEKVKKWQKQKYSRHLFQLDAHNNRRRRRDSFQLDEPRRKSFPKQP